MNFLKKSKKKLKTKSSKHTYWLGKTRSENTKKKISITKMGSHHTKETREKMSNTRLKLGIRPPSPLGRIQSKETRKKISLARTGMKFTKEHRKNIGLTHSGDKSHFWKGGITPKNIRIRMSTKHKEWSKLVMIRDNFTCQKYKTKGGNLVAHHIVNFSSNPKFRFKIDNGITLSQKAHIEFHKIYGNKNNTREQLIEFLKSNGK